MAQLPATPLHRAASNGVPRARVDTQYQAPNASSISMTCGIGRFERREPGGEPVSIEVLDVTTEPDDQLGTVVCEPEAARPGALADELDVVAVDSESFDEEIPSAVELHIGRRFEH